MQKSDTGHNGRMLQCRRAQSATRRGEKTPHGHSYPYTAMRYTLNVGRCRRDHGIGDVIPGAGGARKLRWAAKGKGKRGGARNIYVYIVVAARIYLLRCYAKNVRTDLTEREKKELRQIAADL